MASTLYCRKASITIIVRYMPNTVGVYPVDAAATPYRTLPECLVRPQYPTQHFASVRYEFGTGTRHFGKFGLTSMSVPDTSVSSGRPPRMPEVPVIYLRTYPREKYDTISYRTYRWRLSSNLFTTPVIFWRLSRVQVKNVRVSWTTVPFRAPQHLPR